MVKLAPLYIAGGVAVAAALGLYVWRKGGVTAAASSLGAGAVNAAGGAVSGAVGAAGAAVGLPTPQQTTTDASVARWIIDNAGHLEASKWAGAPAYVKALLMEPGTGTAPPPGSEAAKAFASLIRSSAPAGAYDETARLLARYPDQSADRAAGSVFDGVGSFSAGTNSGFFDLLGVRDPAALY